MRGSKTKDPGKARKKRKYLKSHMRNKRFFYLLQLVDRLTSCKCVKIRSSRAAAVHTPSAVSPLFGATSKNMTGKYPRKPPITGGVTQPHFCKETPFGEMEHNPGQTRKIKTLATTPDRVNSRTRIEIVRGTEEKGNGTESWELFHMTDSFLCAFSKLGEVKARTEVKVMPITNRYIQYMDK